MWGKERVHSRTMKKGVLWIEQNDLEEEKVIEKKIMKNIQKYYDWTINEE